MKKELAIDIQKVFAMKLKNDGINNCIYFWSWKYNEIAIICFGNYQENQKNWQPFNSIESIVCIYSIESHKKIEPDGYGISQLYTITITITIFHKNHLYTKNEKLLNVLYRMSSCYIFLFSTKKLYNRIEIKIDSQLMLFINWSISNEQFAKWFNNFRYLDIHMRKNVNDVCV